MKAEDKIQFEKEKSYLIKDLNKKVFKVYVMDVTNKCIKIKYESEHEQWYEKQAFVLFTILECLGEFSINK